MEDVQRRAKELEMSASYTTVSLMLMTYPAITSRTNVSSAELDRFAQLGEGIINAHLAARYTLPFSFGYVPQPLETIATSLGSYFFLSRRVFTQEKRNESSWVTALYKESMDLLKMIKDGELALTGPDGSIINSRTDIHETWSNTMDYHPTMTEDYEELMVVDADKIDDLRAEREQSEI